MRNTFRNNDGFTLVELLVTILTGSIIMLAAVSVLLLGVRINNQSMGTANRQTTTRILMSSLEDLAAEGAIQEVASDMLSWKVKGKEDDVLYAYNSADQTISSGSTVILEGVITSDVELNKNLLTVTVTTEDGTYTSSVYCRLNGPVTDNTDKITDDKVENLLEPPADVPVDEEDLRYKFLQKLVSQYAISGDGGIKLKNPGMILVESPAGSKKYVPTTRDPRYFSQWYIGGGWSSNGWGPSTPWCACFVSWGLLGGDDPLVSLGDVHPKGFANVDNFMNYLKKNDEGHQWKYAEEFKDENEPQPGDLIFFDWKVNNVRNPEHIGAVIKVEGDYVYTIEGNSSNRVAIRKYGIEDPRIIGYGVLDWTAHVETKNS